MSALVPASAERARSPLAADPPALSIELARELRRAASELQLEGDVSLKPGSREALRWRAADLECVLQPIGDDALDRVLASLSTMIVQNAGEADGKLALRLARHDLKPLPEFALRAAAEDFRRGLAGDGRFRPTVAELSRLTRLKALRFAEEAAQIKRVLAAPERKRVDPVEKANVARGIAELIGKLSAASAEQDLADRQATATPRDGRAIDEIMAEHARRGPVRLSAAAARAARPVAQAASQARGGEDGL